MSFGTDVMTMSPPTFLANVKKEKKENLFAVIWHEYNKLFSFRQQLVPQRQSGFVTDKRWLTDREVELFKSLNYALHLYSS